MFGNGKVIFAKWLQGMIECLILLPIILAVGILSVSSSLLWIWIGSLPLLFLTGLLSQTLFSGKKRWVYLLISLIGSAIIPLLFMGAPVPIAISWLVGLVWAYRGVLCAKHPSEGLFSIMFLWVGLLIYFVAYFFYRYVPAFHSYMGLIAWAGILTLGLTLFLTNHQHLKSATLSEDQKPILARALKVQNRFFILITFVIILLIANFRLLKDAFSKLTATILHWIILLFSLFNSHQSPKGNSAPSQQMLPFTKKGEPSAFAALLDKILVIVVYVVLIAAAILLLVYVIKKLKGPLKRAFSWLHTFLNQLFNIKDREDENQQYIDEKESVMTLKEWRKNYQDRLKDWLANRLKHEPRWEDLQSNREKVRYLYRHSLLQLMKEGYSFKASDTPGETILEWKNHNPEDKEKLDRLEEVYGKARYGDREIKDQEIKDIDSFLDR